MTQYIKDKLTLITAFVVLSTIIMVGTIKSSTVLGGDQSLFVVIAQLLDSGKILYKDIFDYKQPGIYLFYLIAGKTIGWSDVSIHLFELGYWVLFSLILFFAIRKYSLFHADYFNGLLPFFIVGVYYCNATAFHLTQLEAIIIFPLFLIVWLLDQAYKAENKNGLFVTYFAVGILIGIVLLSKLVFSPIIFSFLLIHFIFTLKSENIKFIISKQIFPLIIGFVIPLSLFLLYIFTHRIENLVFDIFFKIPTSVVVLEDQVDPDRLASSIKWFIKKMSLLLIFAAIGSFFLKKESHFLGLILSWGVIGFFVILMQKTSWWAYHFQLLYFPVGIFAALGLDYALHHLVQYIQPRTQLIKSLLIITLIYLFFHKQVNTFWHHSFASQNYTRLINYDYSRDDVADIIKVLKEEDTLYVGGNPRMYLLASRLPELRTNGWILEYYLDFQWEEFYQEFKNKPPTYLFISHDFKNKSRTKIFAKNDYDILIQSKNEKLWQFIINEYVEYSTVENGKWYKKISH
jgi:hypothetical protein